MAKENLAGKILKGMNEFVNAAQWNGESILRSNAPINKIVPVNKVGKFIMGEADTGIRGTLGAMSKGAGFGDAVKKAYTTAEGNLNYKAIAGTYIGASLAGRVATGGGIYRDSTGNVNVPGVPFI